MSRRGRATDERTSRPRFSALPFAVLLVALLAMMGQAMGLDLPGPQIRNVAVFLMMVLALAALARGQKPLGVGLSLPMTLFAAWIVLRVVYDSGLALVPLLLVLWFPFTYFAARLSRAAESSIGRLSFAYLSVASLLYLTAVFGEGLHGPQMINAVYYVLLTLPFAMAMESPQLRLLAVSLILVCVLASEKVTAMLAVVVAVLATMVFSGLARRRTTLGGQRQVLVAGLLAVVGVIVHSYVNSRFGIDLLAKLSRLEQDGGSGRAEIYDWVLSEQFVAPTRELFLGRGQDAVAAATGGISAHNDFLEITFDYGLVGLFLYLGIYAVLGGALFRLVRAGSPMAGPWAASIVVFAIVSFLSHLAFVPTYVALLTTFWGLASRHVISARSPESESVVEVQDVSGSMKSEPARERTLKS